MQQLSKLTSKFQATIPLAVRRVLGLKPGDAVVFEVEDGKVMLRRAMPLDKAYTEALEGTLSEWLSEEDDEAYRDL